VLDRLAYSRKRNLGLENTKQNLDRESTRMNANQRVAIRVYSRPFVVKTTNRSWSTSFQYDLPLRIPDFIQNLNRESTRMNANQRAVIRVYSQLVRRSFVDQVLHRHPLAKADPFVVSKWHNRRHQGFP